jgi:signal transduction histidine kinase
LALLSFASVIYWSVDVHVVNLPDPIALYSLAILLITVRFGLITGIITSMLSLILNIAAVTYLYGTEFQVHTLPEHLLLIVAILSFSISILVGKWIRGLNKEKTELELLMKARDELESITAHELKTPVAAIKLYAQLIARRNHQNLVESTLSESMEKINKETDKLTAMIDNLMDYSKIKNQNMAMNPEKLDVISVGNDKIQQMQFLHTTHKFKFITNLQTLQVVIDPLSLDRILTNLLTNAVKYSMPGSTVGLSINTTSADCIISVNDKGKGIKPEMVEKIFEPFYQVDTGQKGLGLGLYITKQLVEANHGRIWVDSKENEGSTFYVRLVTL